MPPHRMVSPRPETESSGHMEIDSRRGDLPLELPPRPHSRESSQSRNVSTEKSGDFPESSETRSDVETDGSTTKWTTEIMPGGASVQQLGSADAVSKESSTIEEEQASHYKYENKQETGGNPEGLASKPTTRYRTKAAMRAKASTHTNISRCTSGVGTIAKEIASSRMDDPERAQQTVSVAEHCSIACTEDSESGSTMANLEAVDAASSWAGDPLSKQAATAESRARESKKSERGRRSIWGQCFSAQPQCMTLGAPPESVGRPLPYTAVARRLLQILFRHRQKNAQAIPKETSGETHDTMQEMVAESCVPGNRTVLKCERGLESSAAVTSQDDAKRQGETDGPVSRNDLSETSPSEKESLAESQEKPLECIINVPKESKHMASDSASQTSAEYILSSPAAVRSSDHEPESPTSETFSQDLRNEPPKPSITIPSDAPDLASQMTAKLPDNHQSQSSRYYIDPPPHVLKRQLISALNLWPSKKSLIQCRTSTFSIVRKTGFEEQPPPLIEEATSSTKLPDDSTGSAVKAEPSVPRKMPPRSATAAEQKKAPVPLLRLGKRRLSSESESTEEEIAGRPPASRRRAEETRGAGEPQDTSDESIPSPSVQTKYFFRPIELAPVSAGSEMNVARPVAIRAPITARTAFEFVSKATNVSEPAELAVGKLTVSASDRGAVATGDDCSSDVDITSPSSTLCDGEERQLTSSACESKNSKAADDEYGGANESSGSESDITVGALEQFSSDQKELWRTSSETTSDSSETSVHGRRRTADGSGDTPSAVDPDYSNTEDEKESSTVESDAATFGIRRPSQDRFSENYVGRTDTAGGSSAQGAGDSKATISMSTEDDQGFRVFRDVAASHNHS
ncbi:hypothetical protein HPB50_026768 [Hyalomma asiaticum]|uniref:Uncharacterized protein n=1 Tax=Hyalomma asiaticum TaxID=266040 RepID=A0ACB7SXF4_HYAAI|nr:hypothetical protein HPB50_026768 [Hyalomma asiaticum]